MPKTVEERVLDVHEILTGTREYGAQAWFRREVTDRTGWEPGKASVHRWISGESPLPEPAEDVLEELEAEARAKLEDKLRAL